MPELTPSSTPFAGDDIVVWPDGIWATLGEVRSGDFQHKSDDFEIVRRADKARLTLLGIAEELGFE